METACHQTIYGKGNKIKVSKGELQVAELLTRNGISFKKQQKFPGLGRIRFDFFFVLDGYPYFLELDGEQHFTFTSYFYRSERKFKKCQTQDLKKTMVPILHGYSVIRLAYEDRFRVWEHIQNARVATSPLYVSNVEKYKWLLERKIPKKWFAKYL